ncbi:MAG: hypothetical protein HY518_00585 [Candidatus Aenigmarchaeota archaeon]|nr:hypothetical protein [Candidatus Aenigmarchaeota archaeon]
MKGQIWSIDFIMSMIVFFLAIALILFAWDYAIVQNESQVSFHGAESLALSVSDALVRTGGIPEGWDSSSVQVIGLASDENIMDPGKVDEFLDVDYNTSKRLLGIGRYEYYFEVMYANNSVLQDPPGRNLTKGLYPANATVVVPVERYVLYNTTISKLEFILWERKL